METLLDIIDVLDIDINFESSLLNKIKSDYPKKVKLLEKQLEELKINNFNISRVYELNQEYGVKEYLD